MDDTGEENGKESAAVHVDSEASENGDNVVFIATATHNNVELIDRNTSKHGEANVAQEGRDNIVCCIAWLDLGIVPALHTQSATYMAQGL